MLHCSLPYDFPYDAAMTLINPNLCLISGGFLDEERKFMSDQCLALELSSLVGTEVARLPRASAFQTLLMNKEKNEIYAIGGLQKIPMTQFEDVESEYCMGSFCVYRNDQWIELPQPSEALCIPTCYIIGQKIYAAGGFLHSLDSVQKYSIIQVFDIATNAWTKLTTKFDISIFGAIAKPIADNQVLLFGGRVNLDAPSNRIYIMKDGISLNSIEVQALVLTSPILESDDRLFIFSELAELLIVNLKSMSSQVVQVMSLIKPNLNLGLVKKTFHIAERGRFCYHYNAIEGEIYEMNVGTLKKESYSLTTPKLRDVGVCHMSDGNLLLVGGVEIVSEFGEEHMFSKQCFVFDCLVKSCFTWYELLHPQHGCRVVELNSQIFAFAGKSKILQSCHQVFDNTTLKWEMLPNSHIAVWYPAVTVFNDIFYLIGGETENDEKTDHIQTYNHQDKTWRVLELLFPIKACKFSSFVLNAEIIIIGGENDQAETVEQWFKFDGKQVKQAGTFVSDGIMEFQDPPCFYNTDVLIFSTSGRSYKLNTLSNAWEETEVEEVTEEVRNQI